MGIIDSAKEYDALGFKLVAMPSGKKGPQTRDWGLKGVEIDKLTENHNIGVIHPLSGTVSLDIDERSGTALIFRELFKIDPIAFKDQYPCYRGKEDGLKVLFRIPNDIGPVGIKKLTYKDEEDVITVFELRGSNTGTACQDVLPPSLHPSQVRYRWVNPLPSTFDAIPVLPDVLKDLWQNWDLYEPKMLHLLGKFEPKRPQRQYEADTDSADIIDLFNKNHSVSQILENNGYIQKGKDRYLSPYSTSKTPGVVLLDDDTVYSHHGGDQLAGHAHDAFDLMRILEVNSDWKSAFNKARGVLGMEAVEYKKPIDTRPFKFFHASEAIDNAKPPEWLIKNVFESDSLVGLFGAPKAGKSFVSIDMACCIATGTDWHEKKTKEGLVLYLCAEGHRGISRRLLSWEKVNKVSLKDSKFHYSERGVQVLDDLDIELMKNEALAIQDIYKEAPKLIIIDTVSRSFGPGNENSTEDMNRFIANLDKHIRNEFNCCVLLVHHTGHAEGGRGRGSSVLPAALDAEYRITKNDGVNNLDWSLDLEQTLIKDGRGIENMRFNFKECEFHDLLDEEGHPTTSGALVTGIYTQPEKKRRLGTNQKRVFDALQSVYKRKVAETIDQGGEVHEVAVTQKELREQVGDMTTSGLANAKGSLIKEHKIIEETLDGDYVPTDRELF